MDSGPSTGPSVSTKPVVKRGGRRRRKSKGKGRGRDFRDAEKHYSRGDNQNLNDG